MATSIVPQIILPRRRPGPKTKAEKLALQSHTPSDGMLLSDFLHAPDVKLRERYAKGLDKDSALRELARLRKISEIAAAEINQRLIPDESQCLMCKRELPPGVRVTMMVNVKDEDSGIITTHPLCNVECVRQWNKVRMGLAELVK